MTKPPCAVWLSAQNSTQLTRVYTPAIRQEIARLVDLYPEPLNPANIKEQRQVAAGASIALASWGMPSFTKEAIAEYFPALKLILYAAGSVQAFARPFLPVASGSPARAGPMLCLWPNTVWPRSF